MPRLLRKAVRAGNGRIKRQEDPIDVSILHQDLETPDEVSNAEKENSRGRNSNRFILLQESEETEMDLTEQKSQDQGDQKEPDNPTADESPDLQEAEFIESIKKLSKKRLLEEYLQLRKDYVLTQEKQMKKLQKEKKKKRELLQEELEKMKASNTDVQESESEVPAQQQQAGFLNPETEGKLKSLEDKVLNDQQVITNLTAERDTLTQEMTEVNVLKEEAIKELEELREKLKTSQVEFTAELQLEKQSNKLLQEKANISQKNTLEKEKHLFKKIEDLRIQLNSQKELLKEQEELKEEYIILLEKFDAELQQEEQKNMLLQKEQERLGETYIELSKKYEATLNVLQEWTEDVSEGPTIQVQEEPEDSQEQTPKKESSLPKGPPIQVQEESEDSEISNTETAKTPTPQEEPEGLTRPSFWKRFRHFLGLRKPKSWKKKKEEEKTTTTPSPHPSDPSTDN